MKRILIIAIILLGLMVYKNAHAEDVFKTVRLNHVVSNDTINISYDNTDMNFKFIGIETLDSNVFKPKIKEQAKKYNLSTSEVIFRSLKTQTVIKGYLSRYVCVVTNPDHQEENKTLQGIVYPYDCDYTKWHIITDGGMYYSIQELLVSDGFAFYDFKYETKNSTERKVFNAEE